MNEKLRKKVCYCHTHPTLQHTNSRLGHNTARSCCCPRAGIGLVLVSGGQGVELTIHPSSTTGPP